MPDNPDWSPVDRERHALRKGFKRNAGTSPRGTKGKRVIVALMSGELAGDQPITTVSPIGWAVETTRWTLTGMWYDVDQYKVV